MLRPKLTFSNSKTRLSSPSLAISWLNKILTTKKEREKKGKERESKGRGREGMGEWVERKERIKEGRKEG